MTIAGLVADVSEGAKKIAGHAIAAKYFAFLLGNSLGALWKDRPENCTLEVIIKDNDPGFFEIWKRIKEGASPFAEVSVLRVAQGNVVNKTIAFNSSIATPPSIEKFFEDAGWTIDRYAMESDVAY